MPAGKETLLADNAFLVSETDAKGNILFANEQFCRIAEYTQEELIGQAHNIVRHKDMPRAAFKDLWDTVHNGDVWQGFVKNSTKSGGYYWVLATVYPYKNENGEQCYMSCRRKPQREDIQKAEELYKTLN